MTHPLGIITSSVVQDPRRAAALDQWANRLVAGFAFTGIEAALVHNYQEEPLGFAFGMNCALRDYRSAHGGLPDFLLCINDDMLPSMPFHPELWKHRGEGFVTCPTTDFTSCPEQAATGPSFESPRRVAFAPAVCWLMPRAYVEIATKVLGKKEDRHQLFDESLGRAWYEDNLTALVWQKLRNPLPFLIAPTAWAHHEGSRTSNAIPQAEKTVARERFEARVKELEL